MSKDTSSLRPATLCIHAGTQLDPATGGACSPIYTSTAYAFPNAANQNIYPRYFNTPNQRVVARKLAALEQGEDALVFGSGMAAISTLLLAHLMPGDHATFQADLYGGTQQLVTKELTRVGVEVAFCETAEEFAAALKPNTRLMYVESPSNPVLRCVDLAAVARLGRERGVLTAVDNTFATPINQNPIPLGFDAVIHSATKYLNGHSDVNAGAVVSSAAIIQRLTESATNYGGMLDAHSCYQLERGLKTLALRVRQHNENAGQLARFLQKHPAVARVDAARTQGGERVGEYGLETQRAGGPIGAFGHGGSIAHAEHGAMRTSAARWRTRAVRSPRARQSSLACARGAGHRSENARPGAQDLQALRRRQVSAQ